MRGAPWRRCIVHPCAQRTKLLSPSLQWMNWGSNVQVETGHLNACVGAVLCVTGLKSPWVLTWWLCWVILNARGGRSLWSCHASSLQLSHLIIPEIQLTWGINLEKPHSLQTVAHCFTIYMLTGQLSSEWFTKSDVVISNSILCSGLTNSKLPRLCSHVPWLCGLLGPPNSN